MSSEFLHCTICPKKPDFSDVSHLLTHVGSKGHLHNLHSLQVRSHQDLDAGSQLTIYNQWFQRHGVAGLLSERMQQKDQKRSDKTKSSQVKQCSETPSTDNLRSRRVKKSVQPVAPPLSAYEAPPAFLKSRLSDLDFDDSTFTPVGGPRESSYPTLPSSPSKATTLSIEAEASNFPIGEERDNKLSPGTPQLKGVHYPGMSLFDAAPEELRRKRNQKKDGSVVKRLERNAALVRPTETVSSAGGIVLKHRHMDELENDSPVEGEEIPRQSSPKRRKTGTRTARAKKETKKAKRRPGRPRKQLQTPLKQQSSSIYEATPTVSDFSPTEDESREFKLAVKSFQNRKRRTNFTVYQDFSPSFGVDGSSEVMPMSYSNIAPSQTQLAYPPPAWQRQDNEPYDPFKVIRDRLPTHSTFDDIDQGKENNLPIGHYPSTGANLNPLFLHGSSSNITANASYAENRLRPTASTNFDPFQDNDAFMPVRNPLMLAFDQFKTPTKQEGINFAGEPAAFSSHYRQPLFAP